MKWKEGSNFEELERLLKAATPEGKVTTEELRDEVDTAVIRAAIAVAEKPDENSLIELRNALLARAKHIDGVEQPQTEPPAVTPSEDAMEHIWSILCPDCGPEDYEGIVAAVQEVEDSRIAAAREDASKGAA